MDDVLASLVPILFRAAIAVGVMLALAVLAALIKPVSMYLRRRQHWIDGKDPGRKRLEHGVYRFREERGRQVLQVALVYRPYLFLDGVYDLEQYAWRDATHEEAIGLLMDRHRMVEEEYQRARARKWAGRENAGRKDETEPRNALTRAAS